MHPKVHRTAYRACPSLHAVVIAMCSSYFKVANRKTEGAEWTPFIDARAKDASMMHA